MNYLAHAYLSFNNSDILVGNIISDFVKGKKKFDFSPGVQQGIALHRAIDTFTDFHEASKLAKTVFKPLYGLYGAAFVDVVYDHFLAIDENEFNEGALQEFSQYVYKEMDGYVEVFPEKFAVMYPYMKKHNWLYSYRHRTAIQRSFQGLVYRATYLEESENAFRIFEENYNFLQQCYKAFFPAVKEYAFNIFKGNYKL